MTLPRRLLIANRGEIACRIARTARRLGIATIAVHSDADAAAPHVRACDQAMRIGAPPPAESYLRIDAILAAARRSGADAVHPGYGFLSENAAFAEACAAAGLVFVGPPPAAIRAMGSKSEAKALMARAGVPVVPGYHGPEQDAAFLQVQADALGYPVLIKATAGGGGKGMRRVERATDFAAALASCRREAAASFGDERVILERYVLRPRHVEVQVFADAHGGVVHLFERDCSVQRRHQKVLEEAPAPGLSAARRAAMGAAAVEATRAVGYVGAGTVEFILAPDGAFHFMEMNTRLQVEHPVTEMITGLDLVEWQLRVAAGEALPLAQETLRITGHAIEARLYAEDPERGFLPSTGRLHHLAFPQPTSQVRIDSGVEQGGEITPYYDPMIAKLVVHGADRTEALARLRRALGECRVVGVASNLAFLQRLAASQAFATADLDTALIEREASVLFPAPAPPPAVAWLAAAAAVVLPPGAPLGEPRSPWDDRGGWRIVGTACREVTLRSGAWKAAADVQWRAGGWRITLDGTPHAVEALWRDPVTLDLAVDGGRQAVTVVRVGSVLHLWTDAGRFAIEHLDPLAPRAAAGPAESHLRAPMPGRVVGLLAEAGRDYPRGAPLLVLEAMKMEHTVLAPFDGRLEAVHVTPGEQVTEGVELVTFHAVDAAAPR
ncbi:MAG: acetyl/propionyl/methylcrotonyl-CoA carboxylase subunit alpha [Steroidobacteraceae bacterium]|nr:acetyl/propionyl/methylcrotonyl-CoA carboxylase subunit alpha [Steroidobacteraceae bacterium]